MAIVVRFLGRPNTNVLGGLEVYGKRTLLQATVKENLGGKTQTVMECKSEDERVRVLREFFGIALTEQERGGIAGWPTELRG